MTLANEGPSDSCAHRNTSCFFRRDEEQGLGEVESRVEDLPEDLPENGFCWQIAAGACTALPTRLERRNRTKPLFLLSFARF
jgi:hypothetical protein